MPRSRYAAFLRGMNLGRDRRITNAQLQAEFAELGFAHVATFRASGNVAFTADADDTEAIAARLESGLERALGYPVPTFVRSEQDVRAISANAPFPARDVAASSGKLQVAMLRSAAPANVIRQALALAQPSDPLALDGRELYWLPAGRMIDSALDLRALEVLLGAWTMRTKATIEQMAARCFDA